MSRLFVRRRIAILCTGRALSSEESSGEIVLKVLAKSTVVSEVAVVRMHVVYGESGTTAWKEEMMARFRGARDRHIIIPIVLMHRTVSIISIACITENFAIKMWTRLQLNPYEGLTENIVNTAGGARAPGVAVTPRRYRPLALPTKERGAWLTGTAWLRRALLVQPYREFLITMGLMSLATRVSPVAGRARAMVRGMAMATAAETLRRAAARSYWTC